MGFLNLLEMEKNIMKEFNLKFLEDQKELDELKFQSDKAYNDFFKDNYKKYNSEIKVLKVQSSISTYEKEYDLIIKNIINYLKGL